MAITSITHVTLYVKDQDEALAWYCEKLGFEKVMDNSEFMEGFRWLTIAPADNQATQFVLMPAMTKEDQARLGSNAMTVLGTNDCRGDCRRFAEAGVTITDEPSELPWGVSAIIRDLYGNPYNIIESRF